MSSADGMPSWTSVDGDGSSSISKNQMSEETRTQLESLELGNDDNKVVQDSSSTNNKRNVRFWLSLVLAVVLSAIFIYAAVVQFNDSGARLAWGLFYVFQAVLTVLALFRHCIFTAPNRMLDLPMMVLAGGLSIWSIVMVATSAAAVAKADSGGAKAGGDNSRLTDKQEKVLELVGASIGLVSSIYYGIMIKFCMKPKKDEY
jgi:uncharacterized protein YggT (Ycf19 family)